MGMTRALLPLLTLLLVACGPTAPVAESPSRPRGLLQTPITVHAKTFGDEFDLNQVVALRRYAGKRVQITAEITNIENDAIFLGDLTSHPFGLIQIYCRLTDPGQVGSIRTGDDATVVGTVGGQMLMMVVEFNDCAVVG
jgi:hypothetical protein